LAYVRFNLVVIISNPLFISIIMKNKNSYTLILLIVLTIITGLVSENFPELKIVNTLIMVLSGFKFILVAFQFMELKKANVFWKALLLSFLVLFVSVILIVL